jgi:hypothetical protein
VYPFGLGATETWARAPFLLPMRRLVDHVWTRNSPAFRSLLFASAVMLAGYLLGALGDWLESGLVVFLATLVMLAAAVGATWAVSRLPWFRQP